MQKKIGKNKYESEVKKKGKGVEYYIDRLLIRINNLATKKSVEKLLRKYSKDFKSPEIHEDLKNRNKGSWSTVSGYTLKFRKPSDRILEKLEETLLKVDYTISQVEFAVDLITENTAVACELMQLLSPLVVAKCNARKPTVEAKHGCELGSVYFGRFGKKPDNDFKMFKMYLLEQGNDKHGKPALHTEIRLNEAETIGKQGIDVLTDFIGIDYSKVYDDLVSIRQVNRKQVGDAIRKKNGLYQATPQQAYLDFKRQFGEEFFLAHQVYHSGYSDEDYFYFWSPPWDVL